jgi:hypothetical protein
MNELTLMHWSVLILGAAIMGLSKGGIPGAGNLTVALYVPWFLRMPLVLQEWLYP